MTPRMSPPASMLAGQGNPLAVHVIAAGLCCALGYSLKAASPALLANLDHLQESEFQANDGSPIRVARLPHSGAWGIPRLARWAAMAAEEAMAPWQQAGMLDTRHWALLLLCDDDADLRPDWGESLFDATLAALDRPFSPHGVICPGGRTGLGAACLHAQQLLEQDPELEHVLLLGAGSLLDARRINTLLSQQRLQVPGNRDGFFPGEAAAALVLGREGAAVPARGREPANRLVLRAEGRAVEPARWHGGPPNRAEALTAAVRAACSAANCSPLDLQLRVSDANGEGFYVREAANAFTRLRFESTALPLITPAGGLGEVGAAFGPAALAYLWHRAGQPRRPLHPTAWPRRAGARGVLHMAHDNGQRNALLFDLNPVWAHDAC